MKFRSLIVLLTKEQIPAKQIIYCISIGTLLLSWGFGLLIKPIPFSDWLYFWQVSIDFTLYHKGGLLPFIYWPFSSLKIEPYLAALTVNSFFLILATYAVANTLRTKINAALALAFLIFVPWWVGLGSIVNTELPFAGLFVFSVCSIVNRRFIALSGSSLFFYMLLGIAFAFRIQALLGFAVGLCCIAAYLIVKRKLWLQKQHIQSLVLGLLLSILITSVIEIGMRQITADKNQLKIYNKLPLYTGLLVTPLDLPACGAWSVKAAEAASEDKDLTLIEGVRKRASTLPPNWLAKLLICKIQRYFSITDFANSWLLISMNENAKISSEFTLSNPRLQHQVNALPKKERAVTIYFLGFCWTMLFLSILFPGSTSRQRFLALSTFFIQIGYLSVHLFFEINQKYLIAPWTVLLVFIVFYYKKRIETPAP